MAFTNLNSCKSFNQVATTGLAPLSSQECSEVIIINKTPESLFIYDSNNFNDSNRMLLSAGDTFTFRGVTNSNQISAKLAANSGTIYFRVQNYSLVIAR